MRYELFFLSLLCFFITKEGACGKEDDIDLIEFKALEILVSDKATEQEKQEAENVLKKLRRYKKRSKFSQSVENSK